MGAGTADRYLWDHLIEHLLDAGRPGEAEAVAVTCGGWGRGWSGSGQPPRLLIWPRPGHHERPGCGAVLARTAHLLAPTEPAGAVVDVLHSRVAGDPDWGPQVTALRDAAVGRGWLTAGRCRTWLTPRSGAC